MLELNLTQIREDILFMLKPSFENWSELKKCVNNINTYIDQTVPIEGIEVCHYIFDEFRYKVEEHHNHIIEHNSDIIKSAYNIYNKQIDNISTPGLGFSIITNNVLDAALYTSMNKHEMEKQYQEQTSRAINLYNRALNGLVRTSNGLETKEIEEALFNIDKLLELIYRLDESYEIFSKYSQTGFGSKRNKKMDMKLGDINIYSIISLFYNNNSFMMVDEPSNELLNKSLINDLKVLCNFGYVNRFYRITETHGGPRKHKYALYPTIFTSSGKFEKYLETRIKRTPLLTDEKADKIYKEAECELGKNNCYKAATLFGQVPEYKDARSRSYDLWINRILKCDLLEDVERGERRRDCTGTLDVYPSPKCFVREYSKSYRLTFDGKFFGGSEEDTEVKKVLIARNGFLLVYSNGSVKHVKNNDHKVEYDMNRVINYRDIVKYISWPDKAILLTEKGEIAIFGELEKKGFSVNGWRDIIDFICNSVYGFIIGLSSQGNVYVTVERDPLHPNREILQAGEWKDIVKIGKTDFFVYGIKKDGTVLFVSYRNSISDGEIGNYNTEKVFLTSIRDVIDIKSYRYIQPPIYALKIDGSLATPLCVEGEQKQKYVYIGGDYPHYLLAENGKLFELAGDKEYSVLKFCEKKSWECGFDKGYNLYHESIKKCYEENKQQLSELQEKLDKQNRSMFGFLKSKKKLVADIYSVKQSVDFMEKEYNFYK